MQITKILHKQYIYITNGLDKSLKSAHKKMTEVNMISKRNKHNEERKIERSVTCILSNGMLDFFNIINWTREDMGYSK